MAFPNAGVRPQSVTLRDAKGFTATVRYYMIDDGTGSIVGDAGSVNNAIVALSNAHLTSAGGSAGVTGTAQYGAAAQYLPVYTKAVMLFQDATGGLHRFHIPAPKAAIFLADQTTVNPANSLVATYITVMTAAITTGIYVCNKAGVQIVNYFGGMLYVAKPRTRYGFMQLTPLLTPEEPGE